MNFAARTFLQAVEGTWALIRPGLMDRFVELSLLAVINLADQSRIKAREWFARQGLIVPASRPWSFSLV